MSFPRTKYYLKALHELPHAVLMVITFSGSFLEQKSIVWMDNNFQFSYEESKIEFRLIAPLHTAKKSQFLNSGTIAPKPNI